MTCKMLPGDFVATNRVAGVTYVELVEIPAGSPLRVQSVHESITTADLKCGYMFLGYARSHDVAALLRISNPSIVLLWIHELDRIQ